MTFDWAKFQTLATELAQQTDEAAQRTSISRAYYYAFHTARLYVERRDRRSLSRTADAHSQVWDALAGQHPGLKTWEKSAGEKGKRLRLKRNSADYQGTMANMSHECQSALQQAQSIAALLAPEPATSTE